MRLGFADVLLKHRSGHGSGGSASQPSFHPNTPFTPQASSLLLQLIPSCAHLLLVLYIATTMTRQVSETLQTEEQEAASKTSRRGRPSPFPVEIDQQFNTKWFLDFASLRNKKKSRITAVDDVWKTFWKTHKAQLTAIIDPNDTQEKPSVFWKTVRSLIFFFRYDDFLNNVVQKFKYKLQTYDEKRSGYVRSNKRRLPAGRANTQKQNSADEVFYPSFSSIS